MDINTYKLYGLIQTLKTKIPEFPQFSLSCLEENEKELKQWWEKEGHLFQNIASSSDRVNLEVNLNSKETENNREITVKHPISGQTLKVNQLNSKLADFSSIFEQIKDLNSQQALWWCWRFLPEIIAQKQPESLLYPAHQILPDCPLNSYASTVSALIGAIYNKTDNQPQNHPYLLLFTFSPVQEFIKASRKFLDFWSGSYLLHYLSAKICFFIANKYGADAVITPSLWSQEIIDALMVQEFDSNSNTLFKDSFKTILGSHPVEDFDNNKSNSLATAGFPNVITALVSSEEEARKLGQELQEQIKEEWKNIADKVRDDIKEKVKEAIKNSIEKKRDQFISLWDLIKDKFNKYPAYQEELETWKQGGCWEWNQLWEAQINHTWETYYTAIPLGNPDQSLTIENISKTWKDAQTAIANPRGDQEIPTPAEEDIYQQFNVGTWWGAIQARLGQSIQAVKNTRNWNLPTSAGERSTLSGQFSALHPRLLYNDDKFKEGAGIRESSMRLFWAVMAEVYPGLFNGSEKLNAIELTKRMAWVIGGVAKSLGIEVTIETKEIIENELVIKGEKLDYETNIRFPNLSSIASARFIYEYPEKVKTYWNILNKLIKKNLPEKQGLFGSRTRTRPLHIPKTDNQINPNQNDGYFYNGVMFSSKWLGDDLNCTKDELSTIRSIVDQAHQKSGFGDSSPADWWVIVLGDGDSMGKYVSGKKLKSYQHYLIENLISAETKNKAGEEQFNKLLTTTKRMGPATHVGLNRALLDFSNRLVPYITEKRFCGKVVYSGGDDVMAVLPLADLPQYLLSIRAAWSGKKDPCDQFSTNNNQNDTDSIDSGYWIPKEDLEGLQKRPYFTMGQDATMSLGIVIAHKSVPLPTVLETLWTAEKERAKKITGKDGLCFRVIYGGGNVLEALMKGELLSLWWEFVKDYGFSSSLSSLKKVGTNQENQFDLSPLLYRLADELPRHTCITESDQLISKAANVIIEKREQKLPDCVKINLINWLNQWEKWAYDPVKYTQQNSVNQDSQETSEPTNSNHQKDLGTDINDLANLLKFTAFWIDKMNQHNSWVKEEQKNV
jgi:CRISPR-associated protein Cmr2